MWVCPGRASLFNEIRLLHLQCPQDVVGGFSGIRKSAQMQCCLLISSTQLYRRSSPYISKFMKQAWESWCNFKDEPVGIGVNTPPQKARTNYQGSIHKEWQWSPSTLDWGLISEENATKFLQPHSQGVWCVVGDEIHWWSYLMESAVLPGEVIREWVKDAPF